MPSHTNAWIEAEGEPLPLGVTYISDSDAYNFSLYARHATGVTLHLYTDADLVQPVHSHEFDRLRNKTGRTWHCRVPAVIVEAASYYGYSVDGPWAPERGHRFDPAKILLDPLAPAVFFPPDFSREAARHTGSNAGKAPLGVLGGVRRHYDWADDRYPIRHGHDLVIYELHVKGFTMTDLSIPAPTRGTYRGIIEKIPYLVDLGVTAVELMPVAEVDPQEGSYWGYMSLGFYALNSRYASVLDHGDQIDEFRAMVKALHDAGIEVILDVVYNHTTEGDHTGPTYSFRGIDNSTYYLLADDMRYYRNDAGTGNVLRTAHPHTRSFVLDSLRYWVQEMHVDGFRFDLASIFTRDEDGRINLSDPPIVSAIRSDPVLSKVRLIAEAWDITSYQLGRAFPGVMWEQWNGRFRDDIRSFVRGDEGLVGALMQRIYGSDDLFPDTLEDSRRPYQSVNFVTAHDGFTLYDLVSYNHKHNEANGHGNTDGADDNRSWNCGWEGDEHVPDRVVTLRMRQARNLFALLMLANGAPMFRMGDEFLDTQWGNNNPYNQDNEVSWIDWSRLERHEEFHRFAKQMISFRKLHPSIARSRFWREDVEWHGTDATPDLAAHSHSLAYFLRGESEGDDDLYVMINGWWNPLEFEIQHEGTWHRAIDTSLAAPDDIAADLLGPQHDASVYGVAPRSIVVLVRPHS